MAGVQRRLDTLQTVELAEGMEVHLRIAGPFLRVVAYALDLLIEIAVFWLLAMVFGMLSLGVGSNVATGIMLLTAFAIYWFYPVFFEVGIKGATPGKRITGLRVVNMAGGTVTVGQSMIRNFLRGIEMTLPFLPMVAFFNSRFQRLGDLAGGTLVVYSKDRPESTFSGPPPIAAVPIHVALTREERAAIISFRHRSGTWSEARRAELANHLEPLTGSVGAKGVGVLTGMAHWLEDHV
ncbi:MAG: RDD family protein [Verrucomicrobiaceae bacterium]